MITHLKCMDRCAPGVTMTMAAIPLPLKNLTLRVTSRN